MCGIFGVAIGKNSKLTNKHLHLLIDILFVSSESRGKDASGLVVWDYDNDCIKCYKDVKNARRLIKEQEYNALIDGLFQANSPFLAVGHCRLATNGAASKIENAQPVANETIAVAHNGIIVNCNALTDKSIERTSDLDTELLLDFIARRNAGLSQRDIYSELYTSINGVANLLTLSSRGIVAASNNGSLYRCINSDGDIIIWASERRILRDVTNKAKFLDISEASITQIKPTSMEYWNGESLETYNLNYVKSEEDDFKLAGDVKLNMMNLDEYLIDLEKIKRLRRCRKCLLPETMPYIRFDNDGVCNYCKNYKKPEVKGEKAIIAEAERIKAEENGMVLNSFSGGRDSSYSLHYLKKKLGLNVIAYSYDWGMVTDLARRNQSRMCSELGVEFIIVSADIPKKRDNIRKNIEAWIKKPALGLVPLFMAGDKQYFYYANEVAKQNGIKTIALANNRYEQTYFKYGFCDTEPTILNGKNHIGTEQLPFFSVMKMTGYYLKQFVTNTAYINSSLVDTASATVSNYFIPHKYFRFFDYLDWNENEVNQVLQNEYGWEIRPGSSSTWRIGDGTAPFYNLIYYTLCGFTENDCLRSNQIRAGLISREEAEKKLAEENVIPLDDLMWYFDVLGLNSQDVIKAIIKWSPFRKG